MLLLVVLPLQGLAQLVAGWQAHRHVHAGTGQEAARHEAALAALTRPIHALLDQLHAAQDTRLQGAQLGWQPGKGPYMGPHEHDGVFHVHTQVDADVIEVGDATEDSLQGGATVFLAWLPVALALPASDGCDCPVAAGLDWRDRDVSPPLTPPRG
jgi:hypothetical protein